MRRIALALIGMLCAGAAYAQTGTVKTAAQLNFELGSFYINAGPGSDQWAVRQMFADIVATYFIPSGTALFIGNNTAPITLDGAQVVVQNSSVADRDIFAHLVPAGWANFDGVSSTIDIPPGSTVNTVEAYSFYVQNRTAFVPSGPPTAPYGAGVGLFGVVTCIVNNSQCWTLNTALNDSTNNVSLSTSGRILNGFELDFTVASNNGGTSVQGTSMIMNSLYSASITSNAFQVSIVSGSLSKWSNSFVSTAGAATVALIAGGTAASGTNISSQPIELGMFDDIAVGHYMTLSAVPTGSGTSGLKVADNITANGLIFVTNKTGSAPAIWAAGSDPDINLTLAPKGSGSVLISNGGINLTAGNYFSIGVVSGVTCAPGSPSGSFATTGGLVTHC